MTMNRFSTTFGNQSYNCRGRKRLIDIFDELSAMSEEDITHDKLLIQIIKYGLLPEDFTKYQTGYNVLQGQYFVVEEGFLG